MNVALRLDRVCVTLNGREPLVFEALTHAFGAAKSVMILRGDNGVGKTMLLNVLSGYVAPAEGAAYLDGEQLTGRGPHWAARRGVVRGFQFPMLCDELTLWENVALPLFSSWRTSVESAKRAAGGLLAAAGLHDRANTSPAELSFGQRRLVELLRIQAQLRHASAQLVLLDEPLAGLDPNNRRIALDLLLHVAAAQIPTIVVEHERGLSALESVATEFELVRHDGGCRIEAEGAACSTCRQ